jgi:hypothetical protein
VGRYEKDLQEAGLFETVLTRILEQIAPYPELMPYLEDMIRHGAQYWWISDGTAPVLLYFGVTYCYNVLNVMMKELAEALTKQGVPVICYDEQAEDVAGLARFAGQRFRAIVGVQTYLMSVYLSDSGRYLHDTIMGPKFNFVLDHPVWLTEQLSHVPKHYYVLTHDAHYEAFVRRYFKGVQDSFLFPPAGVVQGTPSPIRNRKYGVTFVGTYGDYREKCRFIKQSDRSVRFLANHFLFHMRHDTSLTAEQAFEMALADYGMFPDDAEFLRLFGMFRPVVQCVMYYYRERTIRTLLDAGISVDIWGESWKKSPLADHKNLTIHADALGDESLSIFRESKIALNVMAWHKGGFTERMANAMLAGSVLLTDRTTYGEYGFSDGVHCVMFSLGELSSLPQTVRGLLSDEKRCQAIADGGYRYANAHHTWACRAKELLALTDELTKPQ